MANLNEFKIYSADILKEKKPAGNCYILCKKHGKYWWLKLTGIWVLDSLIVAALGGGMLYTAYAHINLPVEQIYWAHRYALLCYGGIAAYLAAVGFYYKDISAIIPIGATAASAATYYASTRYFPQSPGASLAVSAISLIVIGISTFVSL